MTTFQSSSDLSTCIILLLVNIFEVTAQPPLSVSASILVLLQSLLGVVMNLQFIYIAPFKIRNVTPFKCVHRQRERSTV